MSRPRTRNARPADIEYLIQVPSSFSFPSGHAMGSMGVLASTVVVLYAVGTPALLRRIATLLIGSFVFGVALSRVYFGVHYPSDVIAGWVAGATVVLVYASFTRGVSREPAEAAADADPAARRSDRPAAG